MAGAEVAAKHGVSLQRVYNIKQENKPRFEQIRRAELETLQVLKHETFHDLWIRKPAAVHAGYARIGEMAQLYLAEIKASRHHYDEDGQLISVGPPTLKEAQMIKISAELYDKMCRSSAELAADLPSQVEPGVVAVKHRDPGACVVC
jgi:hypothetical protein